MCVCVSGVCVCVCVCVGDVWGKEGVAVWLCWGHGRRYSPPPRPENKLVKPVNFCTSKASKLQIPSSSKLRKYALVAYVSIRQHSPAYASIRQHTSANILFSSAPRKYADALIYHTQYQDKFEQFILLNKNAKSKLMSWSQCDCKSLFKMKKKKKNLFAYSQTFDCKV